MRNDALLTQAGTAEYYLECAAAYRENSADGGGLARHLTDSHCHIYSDRIAHRAVRAVDQFYEGLPKSPYDGTLGMLLETGRRQGISRFVVHSVATRPEQVSGINAFFAKAMEDPKAQGQLIALGTLHPASAHPEADLEELLGFGMKGVKLHPDLQRTVADHPGYMRIYEMCEDAALPVLVHTGDFRYDYSNPPAIAAVLKHFPKLKLIGAHFGGWSVWDEALALLADFPNFSVDTSSSFFWLRPDRAKEMIRVWGTERVMFGSDYPFWDRKPELEYLRRLELDQDEYEDICWRTCERTFG